MVERDRGACLAALSSPSSPSSPSSTSSFYLRQRAADNGQRDRWRRLRWKSGTTSRAKIESIHSALLKLRLARTAAWSNLGLARSATLLLDVHHGACVCTEPLSGAALLEVQDSGATMQSSLAPPLHSRATSMAPILSTRRMSSSSVLEFSTTMLCQQVVVFHLEKKGVPSFVRQPLP